nr:unnamed protein product [Digitaria exilis]
MALTATSSTSNQGLLDAQLELWHTTFAYIKSMALKSALDLGIAEAIHSNGGTATLPQIVSRVTTLHPSKIPNLRRLMRVLTAAGIFTVVAQPPQHPSDDELVYGLTPASQLLVGSSSLAPFTSLILHEMRVSPFLGLATWLQHGDERSSSSLFEMAHGKTLWELNDHNPTFGALFNEAMIRDSSFTMDIVIKECGSSVFQGLSSLVDVAGGLGGAAQSISKAFPHVECSVLDLPHVVAKATTSPGGGGVKYIAGDIEEDQLEEVDQAMAAALMLLQQPAAALEHHLCKAAKNNSWELRSAVVLHSARSTQRQGRNGMQV